MPMDSDTASPMVSVVVPAYNVAPFIGEAIGSVFAQTYRNFEVIVINDGSSDETERRLAPYLDRIQYIKQEHCGSSSARNAGLRRARGRYIALLDGDDVWMSTYLECLVGMLETTPGAGAAFPNAVLFGPTPLAGRCFCDLFPFSEPITFERILTRECNIFGGVVFRRHIMDEVGSFDERLTAALDFDFWLRMAQRGHRFLFTTEPLVRYRIRRESISAGEIRLLRNYLKVLRKVQLSPATTSHQQSIVIAEKKKVFAQLNRAVGKECILRKEYRAAAKRLRLANKILRNSKLALVTTVLRIAPYCIYHFYRHSTRRHTATS